MEILRALCSVPTAPFVEDRVVAFAERFVAERPGLSLQRDEHGNLLISLPGKPSRRRNAEKKGLRGRTEAPRLIFTAHMDHPGFVAKRMAAPNLVQCDFRGGVLAEYVNAARVRFFTQAGEVAGVVESAEAGKGSPYATSALVRVDAPVARNTPGMFDQGEGRFEGNRFLSRVCDDLAGAAAAFEALDSLHKRPAEGTVALLLTRAEEVGFIGAIAASLSRKLVKPTDRLIAIECSAMQAYAPQGAGPIVRIGDRTSIFNSAFSFFITQQAEALSKRDKAFKFQRALMPGGTCEATVYDVYGFIAGSICVALGNYHNMDREAKRIGPEYIDVEDYQNMVRLFIRVARQAHTFEPGHGALRQRLEKRFRKNQKLL